MKWWLYAAASATIVLWLTPGWGGEPVPQAVVGTIISMQSPEEGLTDEPVDFDLRMDQSGPKGAAWRPGDTLAVRASGGLLYGVILGDQVRLTLSPGAPGQARRTVTEVFRLGRGEFVRPGQGASIDTGPASAKVLVKMLVPLDTDCHQRTASLLQELAKSESDRVRLQIFDYHRPEGVAETNRERLSCATVLVNNRYEFTLGTGDQTHKVSFQHRPNVANSVYNSEDVVVVVRQEIARLYPPPPKPTGAGAPPSGQRPAAK